MLKFIRNFFGRNVIITNGKNNVNIINNSVVGGNYSNNDIIKSSGKIEKKQIETKVYLELNIKGPINVNFNFSHKKEIEVIADEKIIDLIEFNYIGAKLKISLKDNTAFISKTPIIINISQDELAGVSLIGSGNVEVTNINQNDFHIFLKGSGNVDLSGSVSELNLKLNGSGDIKTGNLDVSNQLNVDLKGSGNIEAKTSNASNVVLIGSGDVTVYGDIKKSNTKCLGSGDIRFKRTKTL